MRLPRLTKLRPDAQLHRTIGLHPLKRPHWSDEYTLTPLGWFVVALAYLALLWWAH